MRNRNLHRRSRARSRHPKPKITDMKLASIDGRQVYVSEKEAAKHESPVNNLALFAAHYIMQHPQQILKGLGWVAVLFGGAALLKWAGEETKPKRKKNRSRGG